MRARNLYGLIVDSFPSFYQLENKAVVLPIVEGVLRGLIFETSSFSKSKFYASVFSFPICYPEASLYLNFGFRLKSYDGVIWDADLPSLRNDLVCAMQEQGEPYLNEVRSSAGFASSVRKRCDENLHTTKALAFAYARARMWPEATTFLKIAIESVDPSIRWQQEIRELCCQLFQLIEADVDIATQKLFGWEQQTIANLELHQIPQLG